MSASDGEHPGSRDGAERAPEVGYDTGRPARSLYETAREVMLRPREFFEELSPEYGRGSDHPVWFVVAVWFATMPLFLLASAFAPLGRGPGGTGAFDAPRNLAESVGLPATVVLALLLWVFSPLFAVISLLISSALVHVLVWLFVPNKRDYYATMKVLAYSSSVSFLTWIPVLGYLAVLYAYYVG